MALCEQCGSIQVVRAVPEFADKLVAYFSAKRPFFCRRCGWRGRRDWSDDALSALMNYGAGGAEPDPDLAVLDAEPKQSQKRSARKGRQSKPRKPDTPVEQFDLATLELTHREGDQAAETSGTSAGRSSTGGRRSVRIRRTQSRRREIVATIVATALVMLLVVLLGLTGSCGSEGA